MTVSFLLDELVLHADAEANRAALESVGYYFEVSARGTSLTSAEQTITSIQSQLFDGEAITEGSYGNMKATVFVRVRANDSAALGTGAAQLISVIRRPGSRELVYIAADGASPATVFDALHIQPALRYDGGDEDDIDDAARHIRTYELTLTCKPFPRSDTEVLTQGSAVSAPAFTLIDDVNTSTAWSAQDPDSTLSPFASTQSWTPLRYNIMPRPLVSETAKATGWSAGSDAISISWSSGKMVVTGKPTSSTTRVYANSPVCTLVGTSPVRLRFEMGGSFQCNFGMVYRWFNSSRKQIGNSLTITEVPRTSDTHTISALVTPPSGAVYLVIYPYARFTNSTGGVRTYTVRQVFAGSDGASFFGSTADTATNTYDWTGAVDASAQVELGLASMVAGSGQVSVTAYHHPAGGLGPVLTRTATWATTDAAPFLVVSGKVTGAPASVQIYGVPGRSWINPDVVSAASDGTYKAYFSVGARSESSLNIRAALSGTLVATTATLTVTQLDAATSLPAIGTGRQGKFGIDVQGTMPAEASLQVANTGGVGANVLIYTGPANPDFAPPLSPYLVAAGTADGTTISNKKFTVATSSPSAETWVVPHPGLTESTYAVFAKLSGSGLTTGSAYTFSIAQHTSSDGGATYYGDNQTTTAKVIAKATTFAGFAQIGTLRLPTVLLDKEEGAEGLKLWVSGGTWVLDEAWLFDLVNGSISHVLMPSTTYPNVTVKAASPDHPQQRFMVSYSDGTIRDLSKSVQIWGNHRLDPAAGCDTFAICDAATPALSVSASYYPRWDMFAAPLAEDGTT